MKLIISGVQLSLVTKHLHSFVSDFDNWLGGRVKETNNPHTLTKAFYLFISVKMGRTTPRGNNKWNDDWLKK